MPRRNERVWFTAPNWAGILCEIMELLETKLDIIMSSLDDLKAAQAETDTKIDAVKTDFDVLLQKLSNIPTGGLTPDQQQAIDDAVAHAQAINDRLGAIDTSANNGTPETPAA